MIGRDIGNKGLMAPSRSEIDAVFVSIHERWNRGDIEAVVRAHFHPEARLQYAGAGTFPPFSGTHRGHRQIISAAKALLVEFTALHSHVHDIVAEGNRVNVHGRLRLRHHGTSRIADVEVCDRYVLDPQGRVLDWVAHCDTGLLAYLADSFGPLGD